MFVKLYSNKSIYSSTIIFNLLILAIILLMFSSCTTPRSIGYKKQVSPIKSQNKNIASEESAHSVISNKSTVRDITYIPSDEKDNQSNIIHNTFKKLPTLREQMNSISEEQIRLNNEVVKITNELTEIKTLLHIINEDIINLKNGTIIPAKGFSDKTNLIPNSNIILSDEEESKSNKQLSYTKVPIQRPNNKNSKTQIKRQEIKTQPKIESSENNSINSKDLFDTAVNDYNSKDYNSSIQKFKTIVEKEKNQQLLAESHYYLGENYFKIQNYQMALNHYRNVIKLNNSPKKDISYAMIAECLMRMGDVNEAKLAYQELIDKYPQSEFIPKARKMLQQL